MLKFWKIFYNEKKAVVSMQFAIIFPFLIFLFLAAFEFSRIMIIGSALDLVTTEITRQTAISEQDDYAQKINNLIQSKVPLWPYIANPSDFKVTIKYCEKVRDIIDDQCQSSLRDDTQILLFDLKYRYLSVFPDLFAFLDTALTRKTVVYREFINNQTIP